MDVVCKSFLRLLSLAPKLGTHKLNFKPNFKCSPLKFWGLRPRLCVRASKPWPVSSACKNLRGRVSSRFAETRFAEKIVLRVFNYIFSPNFLLLQFGAVATFLVCWIRLLILRFSRVTREDFRAFLNARRLCTCTSSRFGESGIGESGLNQGQATPTGRNV